jgi:hypothetical protein
MLSSGTHTQILTEAWVDQSPPTQHYLSMAHRLPRLGGLGIKYRWGQGAYVVKYSSHAQGRYVSSIESPGVLGLIMGEVLEGHAKKEEKARGKINEKWRKIKAKGVKEE